MPEDNPTLTEPVPSTGQPHQPNLGQLLKVWLKIGLQSFGGGSSTNLLIQNEFIYKRGWLSVEQHLRFWVLCQLVPGINLIALTILIGKKLGGAAGIAVSLVGMLLPSTGITTLLAIGFSVIQGWPPIQGMLKGLTPASAGISLVVALQFANPLLRRARKEGVFAVALSLFIIGGGAAMGVLLKLPVVTIFIGGAIVGAVGFSSISLNRIKKA